MRRLFEEFRITKKPLQSDSKTALGISFHQKQCSTCSINVPGETNGDNQKTLLLVTVWLLCNYRTDRKHTVKLKKKDFFVPTNF